MTQEFVTYEQALSVKELGFDEPCLAFYDGKNTESVYFNHLRNASGDYIPFQKHDRLKWFGAPLKQQAFRWFREKHGLYSVIDGLEHRQYYKITQLNSHSKEYDTYEEAEQACLDKLIEICKNKQI